MKKKLLISLCGLMLLSGCGSIQLTNGENALVTFKEGNGISTDDLYQEMKSASGASTTMSLIDGYLLDIKYDETDEEKQYIKEKIKAAKESAESMSVSFELYLYYYMGVADEEAYESQLRIDYRRDLYAHEYAKTEVTDTQIEEYYESEIIGDIEASQILIPVDVDEDATDDEKTEAKNAANDKAKEIIEKLKNGEDFANLAKENSADTLTSSKGGSLGKVNKDDVSEEIIDALISLKDGEFTKTPIESTTGYYILYRTSQDEKEELNDDLKAEIKETIANEIAENTNNYKYTAMKALREEYEMDIKDTELLKDFEDLISNYQ